MLCYAIVPAQGQLSHKVWGEGAAGEGREYQMKAVLKAAVRTAGTETGPAVMFKCPETLMQQPLWCEAMVWLPGLESQLVGCKPAQQLWADTLFRTASWAKDRVSLSSKCHRLPGVASIPQLPKYQCKPSSRLPDPHSQPAQTSSSVHCTTKKSQASKSQKKLMVQR